MSMSPLLTPEPDHTCAPPSTGAPYGSTWDCPSCQIVWMLTQTRHAPYEMYWEPASMYAARRHRERLAARSDCGTAVDDQHKI